MIVLAAVRLVARRASLPECWLVQNVFLRLFSLIGVAAKANVYCVSLGQARLPAGMRIVAIGAITRRSRMRHFGLVNLLGLVTVTGHAERLNISLREHHLAVFGGSVAHIA